jgi:predicted dienelactone hydrolase
MNHRIAQNHRVVMNHQAKQMKYWISGLLGAIAVLGAAPSHAAEQLTLRFGPFEQTVTVNELEQFAKTGEMSSTLQPYAMVLTPDVRKALNKRLDIDPKVSSQVVGDILKSPSGKQLLESLQKVAPGLSVEMLQAGIGLAANQAKGLDAISVIRAIPQKKVTIDVSEAINAASKINLSYWKTQALRSLLDKSLSTETKGFQASFDPTAAGTAKVQQQTFTFADPTRNRTLPVDLYWGEGKACTNCPLVVLIPGFEANKSFLAYLGQHLASHGFTVAAVEHPMILRKEGKIPLNIDRLLPASEFIDRPKDISFVLDELAKLSKQADWQGKINPQQVSVIGHSLGGYEALALAGAELNLDELRQFCQKNNVLQRVPSDWLQCAAKGLPNNRLNLRDKRVMQVIALNPAIGQIFGKTGLAQVATPTLILSSSDDTLTPALTEQIQPFTQLPRPKYLLTAIGSTHLSVSDPANFTGAIAENTLVKERRGASVAPLRRLLQGVSLAFIKQATPEANTYTPFLTSAYAQSLSTSDLPLRLNTDLPDSLTRWMKLTAFL